MAQLALSAGTARRSVIAGNALPIVLFLISSLLPLFAAFKAEAYVLSLVCLNAACRKLDLSLAYAVWTGASDCLPPPNQSVIKRRGRWERLGWLPWARRG